MTIVSAKDDFFLNSVVVVRLPRPIEGKGVTPILSVKCITVIIKSTVYSLVD